MPTGVGDAGCARTPGYRSHGAEGRARGGPGLRKALALFAARMASGLAAAGTDAHGLAGLRRIAHAYRADVDESFRRPVKLLLAGMREIEGKRPTAGGGRERRRRHRAS